LADGEIVFEATISDKKLHQELNKVKSNIESLQKEFNRLGTQKTPMEDRLRNIGAELDAAKQVLADMRTAPKGTYEKIDVSEQAERVRMLQSEFNKTANSIDKLNEKLNKTGDKISDAKTQAVELSRQIDGRSKGAGLRNATEAAADSMKVFGQRVKSVVRSALVFTVITQALTKVRDWAKNVVMVNSDARESIAQLKGALLTLAQPLVSVIVPAFTLLVKVITAVVLQITRLVALISGKSVKATADSAKALNKQTNALKGTGNAAKKAAGQLAAFDEINQISTDTADNAGGGASADAITPDFSYMDEINDKLKKIADAVMLIAAGLALWKLGSSLPGTLGKILTKLGGILIAVGGLIILWESLSDAWNDGVNWKNLLGSLAGAAALAGGLALAFGKVGAGIGLVVSGAALLVAALHDMMEDGMNLENTLMSVAGLMIGGLGIAVLTGSWIPLLIAAIASLLVAVVNAYGDTEQFVDGIKTMLDGFVAFFAGIFTGDIDRAIGGIEKIFKGLQNVLFSIVDALKNMFLSFLDWLDEKTGGKLHGIIEFIKSSVTGAFTFIKDFIGNAMAAIKKIFTGIVKFLSGAFTSDWDKAWEGIKDIFDGISTAIKGTWASAINAIIRALNWLIDKANKISFTVPGWVPGLGGKHIGVNIPKINELQIPKLAQGAVIPPNREFMAVLGDQKHGTNIEAPLDTIKQAVAEVLGQGSDRPITIIVQMDGKEMFRQMVRENNSQVRMNGKSPLLT
jgi:predicted  nucleic acid-binding Zn-ribbon protein